MNFEADAMVSPSRKSPVKASSRSLSIGSLVDVRAMIYAKKVEDLLRRII